MRWFGGEYTIIPNGVDVDAPPTGPEDPRRGAEDPLRRPTRGAQGAAGPADRLQRAGRARALAADRDRRRGGGRQALAPRSRAARLDRRARPRLRGGAVGGAARRRRALRAVALRRELRHGPDRGLRRRHPGDRLRDRRLQRRRNRRRRRPAGAARRPAAPRRGAAARRPRAAAARRDGRRRPPQRQTLRLAADRRPGDDRLRARDGRAAALRRRRARRPLDGPAPGRRQPADPAAEASFARSGPGPGRQPRPPHRPPRRARLRRRPRRLPHLGGAEDRRQRGRRKHRPLRPQLGPRRLRPDVDLDVLPRRVLVLDRARRPARPPDPPPRRHLGDDDRRADVGDLAGPPRRAREGAGAGASHRPDAGDLPGPARHPGLADPAEPGGAGAARGDHRLDHAALPLGHQAALRLQPGAADPARRRPGRARS